MRRLIITILILSVFASCAPSVEVKKPEIETPETFNGHTDSENSAGLNWRDFFQDQDLTTLIDTALSNNQELNIFLQEIEVAKNEASARSGAYLPSVEIGAGAGLDKVGRYTRNGAVEENLEIKPGKGFPEPLSNYIGGLSASWEVDIWRKLRNAEKSAIARFLGSKEGQSFLVTNLISEVANSYYELRALDSELQIIKQNVGIQKNALETARLEKQGARITELAVRRFEAQFFKTESLQYDTQQKILETENKINFLIGRFPQPIKRDTQEFINMVPRSIKSGLPSELLKNRADIRQAELDIIATELDIKVAEAAFYPSLSLSAEVGYEAYRLGKVLESPDSLLYSLTGNIAGPLINRRAITADFYSANAKQIQAVFNYERTVLNAFVEASNQISNIKNLENSVNLRVRQVDALNSSVGIANTLFTSARADYTEVLLTQRDEIESKFELVETKLRQMQAVVNLYRALGGGWTRTQ